MEERLKKQIDFIIEIDKAKEVLRRSYLVDKTRRENDAEHSWHLAMMASVLCEHSKDKHIDISHVIKMLLVHDLVEIDAGDTFCYDTEGYKDKLSRETKAADRIFGILPEDQAEAFKKLWIEFDEEKTPDARFAASMDKLEPLLDNYMTGGTTWLPNNICRKQVLKRISVLQDVVPELYEYAKTLIDDSVKKGYLKK